MEHHAGRLNSAADALSHRDTDTDTGAAELFALLGPSFHLLDVIRAATLTDAEASCVCQQLQDAALREPWRLADSFLLHSKHIYVLAHRDLRQ